MGTNEKWLKFDHTSLTIVKMCNHARVPQSSTISYPWQCNMPCVRMGALDSEMIALRSALGESPYSGTLEEFGSTGMVTAKMSKI